MYAQWLYSPNQVGIGSFLGGPFAAVYMIWANYHALGDRRGEVATIVCGLAVVVGLLAALPVLPDRFPNLAIPIVYTIAARFIAETRQMRKEAIAASDHYGFQSNWLVAGVAALSLAAFAILVVLEILVLDLTGVMPL